MTDQQCSLDFSKRWQVFDRPRVRLLDRLSRRSTSSAEQGFSMIEVIVSLVVIAIIGAAAAVFFVGNLGGINGEKQHQNAVTIADQAMEHITSLPAQPVNELIYGRTQTAVQTLNSSAAATRLQVASHDDTTNSGDYDSNAADTPANVPTTQQLSLNGVTYNLSNFVNVCWLDASSGTCGPTQGTGTTKEYRATVEVYWTSGAPCRAGCSYSTSTLIDPTADPTYNSNITAPTLITWGSPSVSGAQSVNTYNASSSCTTAGGTFAGQEVDVQANGLVSGASVRVSSGGGTVNQNSIDQTTRANEIDFCLQTADKPGNYTISVINPDGGHFQFTVPEIAHIDATGWTQSTRTLVLSGGGIENGATVSASSGQTWSTATAVNNYATSPDTMTLVGFTGPSNGGTDTLTVTNPDTTYTTYTITAPNETTTGVTAVAGQTLTKTVAGTGFLSGMTVASSTCNASVAAVTSSTSANIQFSPSAGSTGSCTVNLVNPDGGTDSFTATIDPPPAATLTGNGAFVVGQTTTATLSGSGFAAGMTVSSVTGGCASASVSSLTVPSSAMLTLNGTGGTAGSSCVVTLQNTDGGTTTVSIPVHAAPAVTGYTVKTTGGTTINAGGTLTHGTSYNVTVSGSNFVNSGSTQMSFTENGTAVSISNPTISGGTITFTATLTSNTSGVSSWPFVVSVTNPDGGTVTKSQSYRVN